MSARSMIVFHVHLDLEQRNIDLGIDGNFQFTPDDIFCLSMPGSMTPAEMKRLAYHLEANFVSLGLLNPCVALPYDVLPITLKELLAPHLHVLMDAIINLNKTSAPATVILDAVVHLIHQALTTFHDGEEGQRDA